MGKDFLQTSDLLELGFGVIPKKVMQDKRLSIESKAIYSYFCSYAGAGKTAFPSRKKILYDLCIGKDRFYSHFNALKGFGYIEIIQNWDSKGRFTNNVYRLCEPPASGGVPPRPDSTDTDESCPDFTDTENGDTKKTRGKNNIEKNNKNFSSSASPVFENKMWKVSKPQVGKPMINAEDARSARVDVDIEVISDCWREASGRTFNDAQRRLVAVYLQRMDADVIVQAINKAVAQDKVAWNYVAGILRSYVDLNICDISGVVKDDENFDRRRKKRRQ